MPMPARLVVAAVAAAAALASAGALTGCGSGGAAPSDRAATAGTSTDPATLRAARIARDDGVFLATARGDGSPIPVAQGGPIREVFMRRAEGAEVQNHWIWSLATMDAR